LKQISNIGEWFNWNFGDQGLHLVDPLGDWEEPIHLWAGGKFWGPGGEPLGRWLELPPPKKPTG